MDELIRQISERTGLAPDTVLGFLKQRLPAPVASQLESALSGNAGGGLDEVAKGLGGIIGK